MSGIKEIKKEEVGKIPSAPPPPKKTIDDVIQDQVERHQEKQQIKEEQTPPAKNKNLQLLSDVRQKLLSKVNLTDTFELQDGAGDTIKYTLRIIDRRDIRDISYALEKELNLTSTDWYNRDLSIFEQIRNLDLQSMIILGINVLEKSIIKIDDIDVETLFVYEGSEFKSGKEGLRKYLTLTSTPVIELFSKYIDLTNRDIRTETQVKNS